MLEEVFGSMILLVVGFRVLIILVFGLFLGRCIFDSL